MNIKDYIIQNFKDDNLETIEKAIDDSVNEYNEDTLPGLGIFFMLVSYIVFKEYGVTVFSAALIGGLIGFLWYNKYPAKVFMGDTGSLFLGASVALMAIDLKMPIHLILIGFVYFMETLSVIMQTAYFKYTKKKYGEGRRIFKMSPIHHHFEMCGWKEKKIVAVFTLVTVITCAVAYFAI